MIASPADAACLLVVAPHPDDDVLGCSYAMRAVANRGGRVVVAWLTDGGASHGDRGPAARAALVATRRVEALAGVAALRVTPIATYFLDNPDGNLAAHVVPAAAALRTIVARHAIDALCVTSDRDDHPDHRASFAIAAATGVARRFAYGISAQYDCAGFTQPAGAIVIAGSPAIKRAALLCHASQHARGGARFPMSAAAIDRFCTGPEYFVPIEGRHD